MTRRILQIITAIIISIAFFQQNTRANNKDSLIIEHLQNEDCVITANNRVKLLTSGKNKFIDLFEQIKKAKHSIHLEYFNFRNDSIGNALFNLLETKAKEGVKVRAMFDDFGNWSNNKPLKKKHLKDIRSRGIEIVRFSPMRFPYLKSSLHRDHQKIVVIDGLVAYTGGMNVADYYIKGLPKIGDWHDMHIRIEGDAVRYLQGTFLNMWNMQTGQHIGGPEYFPKSLEIPENERERIGIVSKMPKRNPKAMRRSFAKAICSAKNNIQIITPYFVPPPIIRKAIRKALKNGVNVEILIPYKSDIPLVPQASFNIANKLTRRGANVYFYKKGFYHAKVMMIDSTYCTVGSANLENRGMRYDYETNAFIFDGKTTLLLNNIFSKEKKNSFLMNKERWKEQSTWNKFVGMIGVMLTPIL